MLIPNEKVKLYFTEDKICIGSYNEVAKYEREAKKSYWASEFFEIPPDYNPVGKSAAEIASVEKSIIIKRLTELN